MCAKMKALYLGQYPWIEHKRNHNQMVLQCINNILQNVPNQRIHNTKLTKRVIFAIIWGSNIL